MGKITDEWKTPQDFRDWFSKQYAFPDIDVACNEDNCFGELGFVDGLNTEWNAGGCDCVIWCNPPYSKPMPWVNMAIQQAIDFPEAAIYLLLKNDTSTAWFEKLAKANCTINFLSPRIQFDPPSNLKKSSNNFSSILVEFNTNYSNKFDFIKWK